MGRAIFFGRYRPQDLVYGFHHANVVTRLTPKNWRSKAVLRVAAGRFIYVHVQVGTYTENAVHKVTRFYVRCRDLGGGPCAYDMDFATLPEALDYANGEHGGALAKETRPALKREYPPEREGEWTATFFSRPVGLNDR